MSYDSIYMKYAKQVKPQRQKAGWRLPESRRKGKWGVAAQLGQVSLGEMKLLELEEVVITQHYECTQCH